MIHRSVPFVLLLVACTPDLSQRASRVVTPRVLAVRSLPAEAAPGAPVTFTALLATPDGAVTTAQIDWQFCMLPRAPNETTAVASACLGMGALADGGSILVPFAGMMTSPTATAPLPADVCRRVGPQVPSMTANMQAQRPPDPDITGGYQVPVRVLWQDVPGADPAFARQRIRCTLPDVPLAVARDYSARYVNNRNPTLVGTHASDATGGADLTPMAMGTAWPLARGSDVTLRATWTADSPEPYVLVDPATRNVADRTETIEASWFTNGGTLDHDRTIADDAGLGTTNVLHVDAVRTAPVTLWVVLRDDRGGVDFQTYVLPLR